MITNYTEMEQKWQKRWADAKLNCAERDGRPKFMVIFAYPGVTGYLHVGHMRGFSYADAIGRYKRMTGYNVLFPVGTHATGNGSISLANRIKKGDEGMIDYTEAASSETARLSAEQNLLTLRTQALTNSVSLIEALGGGWEGLGAK